MAAPIELGNIADSLVAKTSEGQLSWEKSSSDGEYSAASSRFHYLVSSRDADDRAPFTFEIYLGEFGDGVLMAEYTTSSQTSPNVMGAIRRLYEASKLSAHGLGRSLSEEILKDLG